VRTAVAVVSAYVMVLHVLLMGAMAAPEATSVDLSAPIQFCHHLPSEPRSLLMRLLGTLSRPGSPSTGTNPEQLFAAGWSACIEITLPADLAVDAEIDLGPEGGPFSLAARLDMSLPGMERATAQRLVEHATKPEDEVNANLLVIATGT
jgi:hypothetical protein